MSELTLPKDAAHRPSGLVAMLHHARYGLRDNVVTFKGKVGSLRRFKDDASEVRNGMECGISIANYGDVKVGDVIEAFVTERVAAEVLA